MASSRSLSPSFLHQSLSIPANLMTLVSSGPLSSENGSIPLSMNIFSRSEYAKPFIPDEIVNRAPRISLGVSRASVTGALRVLKEKGLANYKPYDYVTLTETGRATAAEIAQKHKILESFFIDLLGIEPNTAQEAACKAEHALGPGIIEKLLCFIEFVSLSSENGCDLSDQFQKFCKKQT